MSDWNSFAPMSKLRELRVEKGLSQQALADRVGTSQPQIKRLEDGARKLTKEWAERLAPALHTTAEDIMFGTGGRKVCQCSGSSRRASFAIFH